MVDFQFKSGFDKMDFKRVTEMLAESYWVTGIKIDEVIKSAANSAILVGAFTEEGRQISYARAISDKTRFAYVLDVFVDKDYRKMGIGQAMLKYMMDQEEMKSVYHWLLITRDAHEVYRKIGFEVVTRPDDWMEIKKGRPARNAAADQKTDADLSEDLS